MFVAHRTLAFFARLAYISLQLPGTYLVLWFSDEKIFTVQPPINTQNDRVYSAAVKKNLLDGRGVRVLHPGFWNREAGPDFRGAMVQFDGEAPRTGDIEVDVCASGWHGHGHDTNPNFQHVILHVVWEKDARSERPTLALKPLLDAPLAELNDWLGREGAGAFPEALAGQCQAPLRALSPEALTELLRQAALIRLQGKAAQMHARARDTGWEQALWEGLFRALGYKHNVWPMQRLAELRGRVCPENSRLDPLALQARLLGAGGLLPEELPPARRPPRTIMCAVSGTIGGASARRSARRWCRASSGVSAACAPRTTPNGGWRSPRTGWRPATWARGWSIGAWRAWTKPVSSPRCWKSSRRDGTNSGRGTGRCGPKGWSSRNRCSARRASRIWR